MIIMSCEIGNAEMCGGGRQIFVCVDENNQ